MQLGLVEFYKWMNVAKVNKKATNFPVQCTNFRLYSWTTSKTSRTARLSGVVLNDFVWYRDIKIDNKYQQR